MLKKPFWNLQKYSRDLIKYHSIVLIIVVVASFIIDNPVIILFSSGILHTILASAVIIKEGKNNILHITPISILFLYVFFSYGISAIYIATQLIEQNFLPIINVLVYDRSIEKGYLINIVGIFFLHLALQIFRPTREEVSIVYRNSMTKLIIIFSIGVFFLLNWSLTAYFGSFFVSSLVWLPLVVILYIALTDKYSLNIKTKQKKIIVLILTIVVLILQVFSLSKSKILLTVLPIVWLYIKEGEKKWKTAIIFLFVILFYAYFIYPFVTSARQNFMSTLTTSNLISELSASPEVRSYVLKGDYIEETSKLNPEQNAVEAFLSRMFESTAAGYISNEVELRGFTYGKSLEYVLYGFIPRILWPDKPMTSRGGWFTRYIGVNYASATGMTSFGELYWNFGYIGVAIGMFIIGLLYAGLWRLAGLHPQYSLLSVWLYFLILYGMILHPDAGSVFIGLIQYYILFGFLYFIRRSVFQEKILNYSTVS